MPTQRLRSGCASCAVAYAQHGLCEATYYAKPPRASAEWMLAYAADGALKTKTLLTCSYASMTDILSKWAIPSWPATGHSAANRVDSLWAWIRGTSTISLKATLKWTMYEMNLYVHIHLFMCSNPIFLWRKKHWLFHVHCRWTPEPMDCFPCEQRLQANWKNQRIQTVPKPVHGLDVHKLRDQKLGE